MHSQPPLYNLLCGVLLHLPTGTSNLSAALLFAAMGVLMVCSAYLLLVELGIGVRLSTAVSIGLVADPSTALYEHWLSWSYPTATALTVGVYLLVRFARSRSARCAALAAACFTAAVLTDPTFQWPWLAAAVGALLVAAGPHWRRAVLGASVPVVIVAGWYVKDAAQFGTATTSSWLGMNLWQSTLGQASAAELGGLERHATVDQLAGVRPFQAVSVYEPRFGKEAPTGVAALDRRTSELGVPNFNNIIYVKLSGHYLRDDLSYIAARPGGYALAVSRSLRLWSIPSDQYVWPERDGSPLAGYARFFDRVLLLQARSAPDAVVDSDFSGVGPRPAQLSWAVVLMTLVDVFVAPAALWMRRRDRVWLASGTLMWITFIYSLLVTSSTEVGENMRFRFELGCLPLVLALVSVCALMRERCARRPASPGTSQG